MRLLRTHRPPTTNKTLPTTNRQPPTDVAYNWALGDADLLVQHDSAGGFKLNMLTNTASWVPSTPRLFHTLTHRYGKKNEG